MNLHIPLSRYQKTTRQPRWVVWLLIGLILICAAFFFWISTIWFTNGDGFKATPEGTQIAAQIFVNKQTWPILEEILSSTPLISNRNLTLRDFSQYIRGEFIWFFGEDESRSIAVRMNEVEIPTALLDTHNIIVQKISSSLFLLSEKLQPISGIKTKQAFSNFFPSFSTRLGFFVDFDSKKKTPISDKNRRISINLPIQYPSNATFNPKFIPESAYLVLNTPVYTILPFVSNISKPLLSEASISLFNNLLSNPGFIMLQNAKNPSFLLATKSQIDEKDRDRLIQTILALKYPQKQQKYLKDQTIIQELISDPSLIPIEQRVLFGQEFHHATTESTSLFISKNGELIMSDSEELIKYWLNKEVIKNVSTLCNTNVAYISGEKLLESNIYPTDVYAQDISRILFEIFTEIGLEKSGNGLKLNMCY
jgi:hypothetical protein